MQTVYFATNRQPFLVANARSHDDIAGFDPELGPTSGLDVRYGRADVDVDLATGKSRYVEGSLHVAPQKLTVTQGAAKVLGSDTIFDAIRKSMKDGGKPTIALIHGFSNSFTDAIERAAWIRCFYGIDANMFVFSWPSQASPIGIPLPYTDYAHDRRTAAASGIAVARTMRRLYDFIQSVPVDERCDQSIHLLCHSMGNYVLRGAVQALLQLPDPAGHAEDNTLAASGKAPDPTVLRRYFDKIILAAADEDADAFDDPLKFRFLPRLGQSVTTYYTSRDWILGTLSDAAKFNGPRLGYDGPDNMASISDKVSAVDVSDVLSVFKDPESHQYYRIFPAVRDDILAVLKGTRPTSIPGRSSLGAGRWRLDGKGASTGA